MPKRQPTPKPKAKKTKGPVIWSNLLHLSYNMWADHEIPGRPYICYKPYLRFDTTTWNDILKRMAEAKMNMVIIDLGDGVQYESHPEIVVKKAWSKDRLRKEIAKIRSMGMEPIPKLNFSTCHDMWLGPYARMVSTPQYYQVCKDLIAEVIELFDKPRLFHLGMDEEAERHQRHFEYVVLRQYDLWWHDFYFFVKQVEKKGVRAWVWADYVWDWPEQFFAKMPKSVVQSNWYYATEFNPEGKAVKAYLDLEKHGYDQVPTGSNHSNNENFELTVEWCKKHIAPERLLGFMQTPWKPTLPELRAHHIGAVEQVERAKRKFEGS